MTYLKLLQLIARSSDAQLGDDVVVEVGGEFLPVRELMVSSAGTNDVLDNDHLYLTVETGDED